MIERGGVHWADLGESRGIKPAKRRPVLVIQADQYNDSALNTVIVAVVTSNTQLAAMPGNVFLSTQLSGLSKGSVVNVTALLATNKSDLETRVGLVPNHVMHDVDGGLRRVLGLGGW